MARQKQQRLRVNNISKISFSARRRSFTPSFSFAALCCEL
jgi:hypothetical protein